MLSHYLKSQEKILTKTLKFNSLKMEDSPDDNFRYLKQIEIWKNKLLITLIKTIWSDLKAYLISTMNSLCIKH